MRKFAIGAAIVGAIGLGTALVRNKDRIATAWSKRKIGHAPA